MSVRAAADNNPATSKLWVGPANGNYSVTAYGVDTADTRALAVDEPR